MTAAGAVTDFGMAAQEDLISSLAIILSNGTLRVPAAAVSLTITPSSVRFEFIAAVADANEAVAVVDQVYQSMPTAGAASDALGVTVLTAPVATVLDASIEPPQPLAPPQSPHRPPPSSGSPRPAAPPYMPPPPLAPPLLPPPSLPPASPPSPQPSDPPWINVTETDEEEIQIESVSEAVTTTVAVAIGGAVAVGVATAVATSVGASVGSAIASSVGASVASSVAGSVVGATTSASASAAAAGAASGAGSAAGTSVSGAASSAGGGSSAAGIMSIMLGAQRMSSMSSLPINKSKMHTKVGERLEWSMGNLGLYDRIANVTREQYLELRRPLIRNLTS